MRTFFLLLSASMLSAVIPEHAAAEQLRCPTTCAQAMKYCVQFRALDQSNFDCEGQLPSCRATGEWYGPHGTCKNLRRS